MRESAIVEAAKKAAKEAGWRHRKVVYVGRRGAPDDWFFKHPGRLRIVEFKAPGEAAELHQEREIRRFRDEGFDIRLIDNIHDARRLFDE